MENTAKNFALQLGALVTLYVSIGALISLLFNIITVIFPDSASYAWELDSATSGIRFSIAMLIVFFPAYLALTRIVNKMRRNEGGAYLMLTKWLIYLSLLVGGLVMLGDLVAVLNSFLNGELTARFILKALSVLVVVGAAFLYYLADARGRWQYHERESLYYGGAVSLVVLSALVIGFMHTETPSQVREMHIDLNQVSDLTNIDYQIQSYANVHAGALPKDLEEAYGPLTIPTAPEGREAYTYEVTHDKNYKLCATFLTATQLQNESETAAVPVSNSLTWDHGTGRWCFERVLIDTTKFQ